MVLYQPPINKHERYFHFFVPIKLFICIIFIHSYSIIEVIKNFPFTKKLFCVFIHIYLLSRDLRTIASIDPLKT